jgi:hypothetical protein
MTVDGGLCIVLSAREFDGLLGVVRVEVDGQSLHTFLDGLLLRLLHRDPICRSLRDTLWDQ